MNQTLRGKLTLWYVSSTVVFFTVVAFVFSLLLWQVLHDQIDHHLHIVTNEAIEVVNTSQDEERERLLRNLVGGEGMTVVLATEDGKTLLQTNSPDVAQISEEQIKSLPQTSEAYGNHPYHFTVQDMRFATVNLTVNGDPAVLAVGYSVAIVEESFMRMIGILAAVVLPLLVLLTLVGRKLIARHLYPLELVAEAALEVKKPQQLSKRITKLSLTSELKKIVLAFNSMLGQLEHVFKKEHEFFSDAAHTLKTPLAVVRSQIEGLKLEGDKKTKLLHTVDETVETVNDLLLISRVETGEMGTQGTVSLSKVMNELVALVQDLTQEKQITVKSSITPQVKVTANESLLKRALGNAVHNAAQYVPQRGEIGVNLIEEKSEAVIEIRNSGKIAKEDLPLVFDRFYRGKKSSKITSGSGLGLAISKAVIESLGGSIAVSSANDVLVRITIPVA